MHEYKSYDNYVKLYKEHFFLYKINVALETNKFQSKQSCFQIGTNYLYMRKKITENIYVSNFTIHS